MPTLADSLADLAHQSAQITHYSSLNARPTGPFVSAFLYLSDPFSPSSTSAFTPSSSHSDVLHLIRDSHPSEARLFKFIGESDVANPGGGGGNKRVEKREPELATPLKEWKRTREKVARGVASDADEIGVMLTAAMKLVDDYRPMPRARAHISSLMEAHDRQQERIDELERLIKEATNPTAPPSSAPSAAPAPLLSPDDAIKAEEDALRALESELAPLRRAASQATEETLDDSPSDPLDAGAFPSSSSGLTTTPARPRAPQTPGRAMPHVTNSLVNATTPHRNAGAPATLSRFSPIRFLGTPRAPLAPSGLQNVRRGEEEEEEEGDEFGPGGMTSVKPKRTIFGRSSAARVTMTPRARGEEQGTMGVSQLELGVEQGEEEEEEEQGGEEQQGEDETVRIAQSEAREAETYEEEPVPPVQLEKPIETGPPMVEGVRVDLETIQPVVDKIWATMGEMMRFGVDGKPVDTDAAASVTHLHRLSQSDPTSPPSPTSTNSLPLSSSTTPAPITRDTIIFAHLFLLMLRNANDDSPDPSVPVAEAKEQLGAIVKARGWEAGGAGVGTGAIGVVDLGTKLTYSAVGKKTVRIDRRGGGGGVLRFAM